MFKKTLFVWMVAIGLSNSLTAQDFNPSGLKESISNLKSQRSNNPSLNFTVGQTYYNLSNLKVENFSKEDYLINSNSNQKLQLIKNQTGFHGTFVDNDLKKAYLIKQDSKGALIFSSYPFDQMLPTCHFDHPETSKTKQERVLKGYIGNANTESDVYALESRPGAPFAILLDFDGNGPNGDRPYGGFGNNSYTIINASDAYVKKIWEHVGNDFIGFNVNVTTSHEVFDTYTTSNKVIAAFAEFGKPGWKGVAYVGSYGSGSATLIDVDINPPASDASVDARVASHEVGHSLGLSHDGGGGDPYYSGHGEYVPIMGSGSRHVTHWSIGEFSSANNHEDDIAIINQTLGAAEDDIKVERELLYESNGAVNETKNNGTITTRNDKDLFRFEMENGGSINITAATTISWSNLDIKLRLLDANKNEISSNNIVGSRSANISTNLPSAGTYYLEVDGDGELNVNTGWSDYSSLGYYEISGSISGAKPIKYDAELLSVNGFGNVCDELISPEITVQNNGSESINQLDVDLYIDNNYFRSEQISANLSPGQSNTFTLEDLKETGNHNIEVKLAINNSTDQIQFNNITSTSYTLKQGAMLKFETNYPHFDGGNPFTWEITNKSNNSSVINSTQIEIAEDNTISQEYCISGGCFEFEMTGSFDACFEYTQYKSGTYTAGEVVAYNGSLYKAKWWTTDAPTAASWENMGACPSVNASFQLRDTEKQFDIVSESSNALNGSYNKDFCIDLPTGYEELNSGLSIVQFYPNPTQGLVNISIKENMRKHVTYEVYNSLGSLIEKGNKNSKTFSIDLSNQNSGVYFVKVNVNNTINTINIIKK